MENNHQNKKQSKKRVISEETKARMAENKRVAYNINKEVGKRIREAREARYMTVGELAKKTGYSQAHISNIELGNRYIRIDMLINIAKELGTEVQINF